MTIQGILRKTYFEYKLSPIDSGILLSLALGRPKEFILAHPEKKLTKLQYEKFIAFIKKRSAGEPIAYITGKKEFFGLDFLVNKNVLIPRPETELLVECVLKKISRRSGTPPRRWLNTKYQILDTIIDVGTGSGNIIISIAKNIPEKIRKKINFYAIDISKKSLQIAKANAKGYKLNKKIKFIQSDMLEYFLENDTRLKNIIIIANLPYVSPMLYKKNKNNLRFEPRNALTSRKKGLNHYTRLIREIGEIVKKCCVLHAACYIEISPEQKLEISLILRRLLPKARMKFFKDLAGKWRMVVLSF